ncbi:DUF488 domain-containing protein [Arthrobacter sp. NPDC093128]|jgi:DNA-3-methyladenine glycosylase|uniref:DUF488 domain-containing protein n=1 Tax=Arthrobacter sp. NPDC093128 TaxID=3154979 RepID=UPI00343ABA4F
MDYEDRQLVTKRIYDEPADDDGFRVQYEAELENNPAVAALQELAGKHRRITLLYGARDPEVNHARVLLEFLRR